MKWGAFFAQGRKRCEMTIRRLKGVKGVVPESYNVHNV